MNIVKGHDDLDIRPAGGTVHERHYLRSCAGIVWRKACIAYAPRYVVFDRPLHGIAVVFPGGYIRKAGDTLLIRRSFVTNRTWLIPASYGIVERHGVARFAQIPASVFVILDACICYVNHLIGKCADRKQRTEHDHNKQQRNKAFSHLFSP